MRAAVDLPSYLQPATARRPRSRRSSRRSAGTRGARRAQTARAVELTLDWTARELSESLFETLIGGYNPAFNQRPRRAPRRLREAEHLEDHAARSRSRFHDFSYVRGLTLSGTLVSGIGHAATSAGRARPPAR